MIAGTRPITHEALDDLATSYAIQFLRAALVHHGALPERDEVLHRFEHWIITMTADLPDPDRSTVRRWANWVVLHELRIRAAGRRPHQTAAPAPSPGRDSLRYMDPEQHLTLAAAHQEHLDRWLTDGATTRNAIRPFLAGPPKTGIRRDSTPRPRAQPAAPSSPTTNGSHSSHGS